MTIEMMHSIWTLLLAAIFIGIVVWAWSGRNKKRFETAARSVLEDEKREEGEDRSNFTPLSPCGRGVGERGDVKEGCCGKCETTEHQQPLSLVPSPNRPHPHSLSREAGEGGEPSALRATSFTLGEGSPDGEQGAGSLTGKEKHV